MLHIVGAWLWSIVYSFIKIYSFYHIFWLAFTMVSFNYFVLFSCISLKSLLNWCLSLMLKLFHKGMHSVLCKFSILTIVVLFFKCNFKFSTHSMQMQPIHLLVILKADSWNVRGMPFVKSTKGYLWV